MIWIRLRSAVFLCAGGKNRVWGVSHRLGSFGRIGFFAGVFLEKVPKQGKCKMQTVVPPSRRYDKEVFDYRERMRRNTKKRD